MIVVFTFDDGRNDSYDAANILSNNNISGTFFVTTGFVDGTFQTKAFGNDREPLTIENLKMMKLKGHEVASHGDKHITKKSDFEESFHKIQRWGLCENSIGFSVPNSKISGKELISFCDDNKSILKYVRVGRNSRCYTFINKIKYCLYRFIKAQFLFNAFNKHNINQEPTGSFPIFYSIVIKKDTRRKNVERFLQKFKGKDCIVVLMFHSIVKKANNEWEYSLFDFENICEYVSTNSIKTATLSEVVDTYD